MRFFEAVVSGAALLSAAFAVTIDTFPEGGVVAGQTYTITYSPKDQPATFILRRGVSTNLDTVAELGQGQNGNFSWRVADDLADSPDYALQVKQGTEENYTKQFGLTGGSGSLSSAIASASAAVSSARASASSAIASIVSSASSAAASATVRPSGNSTGPVNSPTLRPSSTTGGSNPPESTGAASVLSSSPLALIFGAVAAFAYLN